MNKQDVIEKGDIVYIGNRYLVRQVEKLEVVDVLLEPNRKMLLLKTENGEHVLTAYSNVTKDSRAYRIYIHKQNLKEQIEKLEEELKKI
ncbi:MAG: hypothetical protein GXP61_08205 [Epsilonproteobacteria bacterium]|nr:hypothetical protein [Campylobacterota bacterium]